MPPANPGAVSLAMADRHRGLHPAGERRRCPERSGSRRRPRRASARSACGKRRRRSRARRRPRRRRARAGSCAGTAAQPLGLTLTGEVPNYVPVTDEMLRNQPAGRLADGAAQLPGLELQPADPDHARQREEPAARVGLGDERWRRRTSRCRSSHNGILYLVHTGNIVQALNGRDGELIWEYRAGPERRRRRCGTWRSTRTSCS